MRWSLFLGETAAHHLENAALKQLLSDVLRGKLCLGFQM